MSSKPSHMPQQQCVVTACSALQAVSSPMTTSAAAVTVTEPLATFRSVRRAFPLATQVLAVPPNDHCPLKGVTDLFFDCCSQHGSPKAYGELFWISQAGIAAAKLLPRPAVYLVLHLIMLSCSSSLSSG